MKKILILAALGLGSVASATTWEYATFTDSPEYGVMLWKTPTETADGNKLGAVIAKMGCPNKQTWNDMLNCAGAKGWELVSVDREGVTPKSSVTYIFKRAKQ